MDPVNCFVDRAIYVINHLDYVAKCCQTCDRKFTDTLTGSDLASHRLQRWFDDLVPHLKPHGIYGAPPTSAAEFVQVNVDRTIDGLEIDRDWRAWWNVRTPVIEAIDWLRESAPYPIAPPDFGTGATPMPPAEPSTPASSTPSVHDIAVSLTVDARCVLQALLEDKATSRADAAKKADVEDTSGVLGKSLRRALESLAHNTPPCIESASGSKGGVWLTPHGAGVARAVVEIESTSEPGTNRARTGRESGTNETRIGRG